MEDQGRTLLACIYIYHPCPREQNLAYLARFEFTFAEPGREKQTQIHELLNLFYSMLQLPQVTPISGPLTCPLTDPTPITETNDSGLGPSKYFDQPIESNRIKINRSFFHSGNKPNQIKMPMVTRTFSLTNFAIATSALAFQVFVLYPWHKELDEGFAEMRREHASILRNGQREMEKELSGIRKELQALREAGQGKK